MPPDTNAEELEKVRKWVADAPHPPGADLANALEAAAFRPYNFTSKGIVIVNSGVSHMQCQGCIQPPQLASAVQRLPPQPTCLSTRCCTVVASTLAPTQLVQPRCIPPALSTPPQTFSWTCARLVWSIRPPRPALLQPLSSGTCRQQVRL